MFCANKNCKLKNFKRKCIKKVKRLELLQFKSKVSALFVVKLVTTWIKIIQKWWNAVDKVNQLFYDFEISRNLSSAVVSFTVLPAVSFSSVPFSVPSVVSSVRSAAQKLIHTSIILKQFLVSFVLRIWLNAKNLPPNVIHILVWMNGKTLVPHHSISAVVLDLTQKEARFQI